MEPASTIIAKLGGPTAVAEIVGVHRTRVHGWMRDKGKGGTGGTIPLKHLPALMALARTRGLDIEVSDFLPRVPVAAQETAA